jgi:hypothetical protein
MPGRPALRALAATGDTPLTGTGGNEANFKDFPGSRGEKPGLRVHERHSTTKRAAVGPPVPIVVTPKPAPGAPIPLNSPAHW